VAAPFALKGELGTVRLSEIPLEVRVAAANHAAKFWDLDFIEALQLGMIAESGKPDTELEVDVAKIERVMSGRTVPGPMPVFKK
jgi:hypothetical protein